MSKNETIYGDDVYLNNLVLSFCKHLAFPEDKKSLDGTTPYKHYSSNFLVNKETNQEALSKIQESIQELLDKSGLKAVKDLNITPIHDQRGNVRDYDSSSYSGHQGAAEGHIFFQAGSSVYENSTYGAPDLYKAVADANGDIILEDASSEEFYAGAIVTGVFTSCLKWSEKNKRYSHNYYIKSVIKTGEGTRISSAPSREVVKSKAEEMLKEKLKGNLAAKLQQPTTKVVSTPPQVVQQPIPVAQPVVTAQASQVVTAPVVETPVVTEQVVTPQPVVPAPEIVEAQAPVKKKKFSDLRGA